MVRIPQLVCEAQRVCQTNSGTQYMTLGAAIAFKPYVVSSGLAVEPAQVMAGCSSLTTSAFEPPAAMHREPVGRACGKGDGRRVQDDGLARPRAETAMEKRLGLRYSATFL